MKTERELFEELPHIKSRLDDVFFIDEENTYLPHQWDDADSVNNMHFINGAWYSWQSRLPEGYVVVPKEPTKAMQQSAFDVYEVCDYKNYHLNSGTEVRDMIYKAMLEAVGK